MQLHYLFVLLGGLQAVVCTTTRGLLQTDISTYESLYGDLGQGICAVPDLITSGYQLVEGCQCECVVSWGPFQSSKQPVFYQKLQDDLGLLQKGIPPAGQVYNLFKGGASSFTPIWLSSMNHSGCSDPVPLKTNSFEQCDCNCPLAGTTSTDPVTVPASLATTNKAADGILTGATAKE